MSKTTSGGSTARDDAVQFLNNHSGWYEVAEIRDAIGYCGKHTRESLKALGDAGRIEGRKNSEKIIIGYWINGNAHVPGNNRQELIDLIRRYDTPPLPNFAGMTVDDLQNHLRYNVADNVGRLGKKWEFRKP